MKHIHSILRPIHKDIHVTSSYKDRISLNVGFISIYHEQMTPFDLEVDLKINSEDATVLEGLYNMIREGKDIRMFLEWD